VDQHLQQVISVPNSNPLIAGLQGLLAAIILARNSREIVTVVALLQKVSV
jgi:hypothetical protein